MDGASRVCSGAHLLRPSRAAARWRPRTRAPRPPPRMHAREMPAARSASAPYVSPLPPLLRSFSCAPTPTRLNIRASSMPRRNRTRCRNWCAPTGPHPPLRAPGRPHAPSPAPACPCAPLRPPPRPGACEGCGCRRCGTKLGCHPNGCFRSAAGSAARGPRRSPRIARRVERSRSAHVQVPSASVRASSSRDRKRPGSCAA